MYELRAASGVGRHAVREGQRPTSRNARWSNLPCTGIRQAALSTALAAILAACSHTPVSVCPAIVPYTAEQQIQVADELETLPPDAMTRRFMTDYGVLRARLRECQP